MKALGHEKFNQTTHLEYHLRCHKSLWYGFNWRYHSGLVAGATRCYNPNGANTDCDPGTAITVNGQPGLDLTGHSADQQFQAGLVCHDAGAEAATPTYQIQQCTAAGLTFQTAQPSGDQQRRRGLQPLTHCSAECLRHGAGR
ncbi:MAG TPA: hypothetical protein VGN16_20555 [Acidobacteriaceae bacterium]